jgi:membrane-bound metal-dependent hydrolase YbcI (DUF457 family)
VDPATHALASLALARGVFPSRQWPIVVATLLAGTLADIDLLTILSGPSAYLAGRHTYTHSILGTLVVIAIAAGIAYMFSRRDVLAKTFDVVLATSLAASVHVLLDLCASSGVALLWPWSSQRFALDWLPNLDVWILVVLIAGILLPELLRLVTSEIGAKDKKPRGRNGALGALTLLVVYIAVRSALQHGAVAMLEPHTYRGESPQRIGAFAESLSVLSWRGVVDTSSNVCLISVPVSGRHFDPELGVCMHKPEASSQLAAAQKTRAAALLLGLARFPRASVDKTDEGYEIVIRDMHDVVAESRNGVAAQIFLGQDSTVQRQGLVWVRDVRLR